MLAVLPYCAFAMIIMSFSVVLISISSFGVVLFMAGMFIYLIGFSVGLGATVWTITSEIFPVFFILFIYSCI